MTQPLFLAVAEPPLFLFAPDATTVEFTALPPESLAKAFKAGAKATFSVDGHERKAP